MSRAFVKEDAGGPDEDPPERPVSPRPNYVTPRGARLLQEQEERLVVQLRELSGAQADPSRRKRKRVLERDLRYVRARLETAIPVDPAAAPKDEVRFGARVRLRREGGGERTLRIVGEDEAEGNGELVPWTGPFVQSMLGFKAGQILEWEGPEGPEGWTVVSIEY